MDEWRDVYFERQAVRESITPIATAAAAAAAAAATDYSESYHLYYSPLTHNSFFPTCLSIISPLTTYYFHFLLLVVLPSYLFSIPSAEEKTRAREEAQPTDRRARLRGKATPRADLCARASLSLRATRALDGAAHRRQE